MYICRILSFVCLFITKKSRGGWKPRSSDDHNYGKNYRLKFQGTRKLNCPAVIQLRHINIYDEFELSGSFLSPRAFRTAKEKKLIELKKKISFGETILKSSRHYIKVRLSIELVNYPVGEYALVNQIVDKKIVERIRKLANKNITAIPEVKRFLEEFVQNDLFASTPEHTKPKMTNRRYYPTTKDIRNHVAIAVASTKEVNDEQESLLRKIDAWKLSLETSNFFLRTREGKPNFFGNPVNCREGNNFLFVHQEQWQRNLLLRYGSDLTLFDATYKNTKYALPLFFLCVHTNVGYKVVAEFTCQ